MLLLQCLEDNYFIFVRCCCSKTFGYLPYFYIIGDIFRFDCIPIPATNLMRGSSQSARKNGESFGRPYGQSAHAVHRWNIARMTSRTRPDAVNVSTRAGAAPRNNKENRNGRSWTRDASAGEKRVWKRRTRRGVPPRSAAHVRVHVSTP